MSHQDSFLPQTVIASFSNSCTLTFFLWHGSMSCIYQNLQVLLIQFSKSCSEAFSFFGDELIWNPTIRGPLMCRSATRCPAILHHVYVTLTVRTQHPITLLHVMTITSWSLLLCSACHILYTFLIPLISLSPSFLINLSGSSMLSAHISSCLHWEWESRKVMMMACYC